MCFQLFGWFQPHRTTVPVPFLTDHSPRHTPNFPTLSCTTAKDEDDDGLSDLGDEESGEDGESQKNLPNYNMANVSLVEEGRSLRLCATFNRC